MQHQDPSAEVGKVSWLHLQMPLNSVPGRLIKLVALGSEGLQSAGGSLCCAGAQILHQEQP